MQRLALRLAMALLTFIIGVTTSLLWPVENLDEAPDSEVGQAVLKMERELKQAYPRRDRAVFDRILADDYTYNGNRAITKAVRMAEVLSPDITYESVMTDDVELHVYRDMAVVSGLVIAKGRYAWGGEFSPQFRFTHVYEKRRGWLQLVSTRANLIE